MLFAFFLILSPFFYSFSQAPALNDSSVETSQFKPDLDFYDSKKLRLFFESSSALTIHNKALELLKTEDKTPAILLLKRNFYQNLFFPSYLILKKIGEPAFLLPLAVSTGLILLSLLFLTFLLIYLKSKQTTYLKVSSFLLCGLLGLLGGSFLLKSRGGTLKKTSLMPLPSLSKNLNDPSQPEEHTKPGEEFLLIKKTKDWLYIKTNDNKKAWILREEVFELF